MDEKIVFERTHLFSPSIHIGVLVHIVGENNAESLEKAIKAAFNANERLSCKIVITKNGEAYYEKTDNPVIFITFTEDNLLEVLREQEKVPFDLEYGELVRFFIHVTEDGFHLLIIAHHLAGDGLSLTYLVKDIMIQLSGGNLPYKPLKPYSFHDLPESSRLHPVMGFMIKRLNRKWIKTGAPFYFRDYTRIYLKYWLNRDTLIYVESVSGTALDELKNKAKDHNVTLNSVFTAAFLKADCKETEVGIAVNTRQNGYQGMGNYTTGISINYAFNEKMEFWKNVQKVQQLIYEKRANPRKLFFLLHFMGNIEPTLIDAAYFAAFDGFHNKTADTMRNMFGYKGNPKGLSITNLTKLDISEYYGEFKLEDYIFIPPVVPNAKRMIGIATLGSKLWVTLHIENNDQAPREREIFKKALSILKELI